MGYGGVISAWKTAKEWDVPCGHHEQSAVRDIRMVRVDTCFGLCVDLLEEYGRFICLR